MPYANSEHARAAARQRRLLRPPKVDKAKKAVAQKTWRLRNADKIAQYREAQKISRNNPEKRAHDLAYKKTYHHTRGKHVVRERKYGVTPQQFNAMVAEQHGACFICSRKFHDTELPPMVDHDHDTGIVRGLLCNRCNWALGVLDVDRLIRALEYLTRNDQ